MLEPKPCRACGKPLLWLAHQRTGKAAPIEVEKTEDGNIVINEDLGQYRLVTGEEKVKAVEGRILLHISHFARCPKASDFRIAERKDR